MLVTVASFNLCSVPKVQNIASMQAEIVVVIVADADIAMNIDRLYRILNIQIGFPAEVISSVPQVPQVWIRYLDSIFC